jgi:hypothetical protein
MAMNEKLLSGLEILAALDATVQHCLEICQQCQQRKQSVSSLCLMWTILTDTVGAREANPSSQVVTTALTRASIVSGPQLLGAIRYNRNLTGFPQATKANSHYH